MAKMKSELSIKNENYISKHRYYELQHHCMQYSDWVRSLNDLQASYPTINNDIPSKTNNVSDPVVFIAIKREYYNKKINRVKLLCKEACPEAHGYLLACVTGGHSYDKMEAKYGTLPISRVEFYRCYRRFFKLLDEAM